MNKRYRAAQGVLQLGATHNESIKIKLFEIWLVLSYDPSDPANNATEYTDRSPEYIDFAWSVEDAVEKLRKLKNEIYSDGYIQELLIFESDSPKKAQFGIPYV